MPQPQDPSPAPHNQRSRLIGFAGETTGIIAVPHYIGNKAYLNANGPNGAPGLYTASFVLARPNSRNSPENQIMFADALRGDSHLAIAKPAIKIDIDPDQVLLSFKSDSASFLFRGFPNENGYLAKLTSDPFFAANRVSAGTTARTAMYSLLSHLSAQLDVPLIVELVEVVEVTTQSRGILFTAPFPATPMAVRGTGEMKDPEFEHTMALYREALNSNTEIYRFLCFYKILEISRKQRERLGRKHKGAMNPHREGEQIPLRNRSEMERWMKALYHVNRDWDEGVLNQVFIPEVSGKKLNNIFDNQLRPIRDKIAHGILDSGELLLLDRMEDRQLVAKWLPFLRCAARRVMKNDFEGYLDFIAEDGTLCGD
ncbi:MAG TPA: methylamine utilization protein MauJ [Candidatus Acidoferrales bacterium]|nr:methylamine utilization protein MauJ [Candidatus Acidoferrales bacterium]